MKTYRAAIVGIGNIAWRFDHARGNDDRIQTHASAFIHNSRTLLVAGCSPDSADRDSFSAAFSLPAFAGLDELLDQEKPDIVSICSPVDYHYEQVRSCLQHKVPMVWLEKPAAIFLEEIDALIEVMEKEKSSTVLVNFQRRYAEAYEKLHFVYQKKPMGDCQQIQVQYSRGLEANGSHLLDMLFYIVGNRASYDLHWVSTHGDPENPSFAMVLENGVEIMVSGLTLPYHCIDLALVLENGRVSVLQGGMKALTEVKIEHELFPGFFRLQDSTENLISPAGLDNCMTNALKDLIDSHESKRLPRSNLYTAGKTHALIEKIRERQK